MGLLHVCDGREEGAGKGEGSKGRVRKELVPIMGPLPLRAARREEKGEGMPNEGAGRVR
jgi:hypothetical protein